MALDYWMDDQVQYKYTHLEDGEKSPAHGGVCAPVCTHPPLCSSLQGCPTHECLPANRVPITPHLVSICIAFGANSFNTGLQGTLLVHSYGEW